MKIIISLVILSILSGSGYYLWQENLQQLERDKKALAKELHLVKLTAEQEKFTGKMVNIPAGTFSMGSFNGDFLEKLVHQVKIKAFRIAESELTWSLYQPCIDDGVCHDNQDIGGDMGLGKGDMPVLNVSYEDITQNFLPWLNEKTNQQYRLPTESEWEYAARAGSKKKYSWGDDIECSKAHYGRRNRGECGVREEGTVKVKSFSANAFGLYDMHGNVWEWTKDCWIRTYQYTPRDGSAQEEEGCTRRSYRGGAWASNPYSIRSAFRGWNISSHRSYSVGFRLAQ
jgi:formylglycine-generating enzyme required for sulfatase activity